METHASRDLPVTLATETNTILISKKWASRKRSFHNGVVLLHLFHLFSKMRTGSVHCVHTENVCIASLLPGVHGICNAQL